ncbi:MAG: choice-of-anchor D domain-containing protein [Verrucomicrobiota bacterium]
MTLRISPVRSAFLMAMTLFPAVASAEFKGGDPLVEASGNWTDLLDGGGSFAYQKSRLEFRVARPVKENVAAHLWLPNRGSTTQDWYLQVDTHLDTPKLRDGGIALLSLAVGNSRKSAADQVCLISSARARRNGISKSAVLVNTYPGHESHKSIRSADTTLRLHFDSAAKTLTGSWNAGEGWKYAPPVNIADWKMKSSDEFAAVLTAASIGPSGKGLEIASGVAYYKNFKTGKATPDIAVEQPAGGDLTDDAAKISFGTVGIRSGKMTKTFVIRNTGTARLQGLQMFCNGPDAADFTFTAPARNILPPGESVTFKVAFAPETAGTRNAALHIASNDKNEAIFDIALTGLGVDP